MNNEVFKIHPSSPENIRKIANGTGLSYSSIKNTFKKGEKLRCFYNSREELKNFDVEKFEEDICRVQLTEIFYHQGLNNILFALTSAEDVILKALNENKKFKDDYDSWFKLGVNIKFFYPNEKGLNLFKSVSALSEKYNEKECEKFWKNLKPEYGNVGTIVNLIVKEKFKIPKDRKKFLME